MEKKSPFSTVSQVGIIVRDMDKAIRHYEALGIGPFEPLTGVVTAERKIRGKSIPIDAFKLRVSVAKLGPVDLELIQPLEGDSLWKEFLETRGEGINHLGFFIEDIEKAEAELVARGVNPLYSTRFKNGGGAAYFDTGSVGGVLMELIQWPPK